MSESTSQPASQFLLAVLGTVTYFAAVIALWGLTSLVLDRDVIDYPDAGPLLGPAMAASGCLVTWLVSWRYSTLGSACIAAIGTFAAMVSVGAIGYTATRGDLSWMILASAHFGVSPFVVGAALLSAAVVLGVRGIRSLPAS